MTSSQHDQSRAASLLAVQEAWGTNALLAGELSAVVEEDALAALRLLPDSSVSLVLTDPPYHSTKKGNILGDADFASDAHYLEWMAEVGEQLKRVLRPNGSAFVFCAPQMSSRLEVALAQHLRPLNHITWTKPNRPGHDGWKGKMRKEALRRWYPHSERILFLEQGTWEDRSMNFARLLREYRLAAGLSGHRLTELVGAYGATNHGGAVSNWETGRNTPSPEQYEKIREAIIATGRVQYMPLYEDAVRPFAVGGDSQFTDVWDFESVRAYRGKHPAEKPQALLQHAISATTYPGDIVLDCFSGSGSTLKAALATGRRAIGCDLDPAWAKRSAEQARAAEKDWLGAHPALPCSA